MLFFNPGVTTLYGVIWNWNGVTWNVLTWPEIIDKSFVFFMKNTVTFCNNLASPTQNNKRLRTTGLGTPGIPSMIGFVVWIPPPVVEGTKNSSIPRVSVWSIAKLQINIFNFCNWSNTGARDLEEVKIQPPQILNPPTPSQLQEKYN